MFNVKSILEKVNHEGYSVVAIRHCTDDENYSVGDMCLNSYDWDLENDRSTYGTEIEEELPGTCGISIPEFIYLDNEELAEAEAAFAKALKKSSPYQGKAVVIAGTRYEYGYEDGEVIIWDAEVIAA